jgi:hypothetical protein
MPSNGRPLEEEEEEEEEDINSAMYEYVTLNSLNMLIGVNILRHIPFSHQLHNIK